MGVCENHLEFVSDWNSSDHITDGGLDGSNSGVSFFSLKPHFEFKDGLSGFSGLIFVDFHGDVFESFGEGAEFAFNSDFSSFDCDGDVLWDFEVLFWDDELHIKYDYKK